MTRPAQIPSLQQLQHWLQAVITHPGGVEEGARLGPGSGVFGALCSSVATDTAAKDSRPPVVALEDIVPPSSQQSSAERLGVYAAAYYLRLVDCLREFFLCLRYALGEEVFGDFALAYLQRHPSQSYTLHRLADQFADFLSETQPADGWGEFFVDLTRLEHAIEIVFDAQGPEEPTPLERGQGEGLAPSLTPQSILALVPGFQLLAFRYPVSSYYTAWKQGDNPPLPDPQNQCIALFRRDYIVRRHELTSLQHALLSAVQSGASLEQALSEVAPQALAAGQNVDTLAADLREWFEGWTRAGFFLRT